MASSVGGLAGWLMERWRGAKRPERRLALVEKITLAPRQSLALVEAEGRRILVATSAEGAPAFYPLDEVRPPARPVASLTAAQRAARISW
jgi:flagellar biogenesis protein FliO